MRKTQTERICDLLSQLGASANYNGYCQAAYAVALAVENPQRLQLVTKRIYPQVAAYYHTTPRAVERNLRTLISIIWEKNSRSLSKLAEHNLLEKPSSSQFLAILSHVFPSGEIRNGTEHPGS